MIEDELPSPQDLTITAMLFEGGLGAVAIVIAWTLGRPLADLIDWNATDALWGAAAALPLVVLLAICVRVPCRPFTDISDVIDRMLVPMFQGIGLLNLAVISALAGLGEELLFRGLLQHGLTEWIGGPAGIYIGLAAASVIFGLFHPVTTAYAVLAALMGLYLGLLWIGTQNLLVPITAHAVYDFLALAYLVKLREPRPQSSPRKIADEEEAG